MSTKVITLPDKSLKIVDKNGIDTGTRVNTFIDCLRIVIENVPHKNTTDITLTASISEKIDDVTLNQKILELEDAEIEHINQGIKQLMEKGIIAGSKWIHLIIPLREAKSKQRSDSKK